MAEFYNKIQFGPIKNGLTVVVKYRKKGKKSYAPPFLTGAVMRENMRTIPCYFVIKLPIRDLRSAIRLGIVFFSKLECNF